MQHHAVGNFSAWGVKLFIVVSMVCPLPVLHIASAPAYTISKNSIIN